MESTHDILDDCCDIWLDDNGMRSWDDGGRPQRLKIFLELVAIASRASSYEMNIGQKKATDAAELKVGEG